MKTRLQKYPTIRLGIQLCGVLVVILILAKLLAGHVASDDELRALFVGHRTELEALKRMSMEDMGKPRQQDFYVGRDEYSAQLHGITADRFHLYSELIKKMGVRAISGDKDRVRFHISRVGWAGEGLTKGLLWCAAPITNLNERIEGIHHWVVNLRYVPLEDGWYVFESDAHNE